MRKIKKKNVTSDPLRTTAAPRLYTNKTASWKRGRKVRVSWKKEIRNAI